VEIDSPHKACTNFRLPFASTVLRALFEGCRRAHQDPSVKAIVVIGSGRSFSAGFDIAQFKCVLLLHGLA
jgi:enoyl-CoA hydratase/carnithine racemase